MRLRLVSPTIDKEAEFVSMLEEFRAVGEAHFVDEDIKIIMRQFSIVAIANFI